MPSSSHLLDLKKKDPPFPSDRAQSERKIPLIPAKFFEGEILVINQQTDWLWAGIILIFLFFLGLIFLLLVKEILTVSFFWLLAIVFIILIFKPKKPINWRISKRELKIGDFLYSFENLRSFWITYALPFKELSFQSKKWYYPYIKIPLNDQNPLALREFLLNYLPEEEHQDTIVEILNRKLGI